MRERPTIPFAWRRRILMPVSVACLLGAGLALTFSVRAEEPQARSTTRSTTRSTKTSASGTDTGSKLDPRLEEKLNQILENQQKMSQRLDEVMEELKIVKIRATLH